MSDEDNELRDDGFFTETARPRSARVLQTRDKPPPHPDSVRRMLSYTLVGLLTLVILGTLAGFIFGAIGVDELKELSILITPVLTLTGTAVGFYFGSADNRTEK